MAVALFHGESRTVVAPGQADILKFGADVEVLSPAILKKRVRTEISRMASRYA
jgi:predicted DNA-binding transcriptional regulator YafY